MLEKKYFARMSINSEVLSSASVESCNRNRIISREKDIVFKHVSQHIFAKENDLKMSSRIEKIIAFKLDCFYKYCLQSFIM